MVLPFIAAIVVRAAVGYAIKTGVRIAASAAARRAAAAAAAAAANNGIRSGRRILQREIQRRRNCRTCRKMDELVSPCQLLAGGLPTNSSGYKGGSYARTRGDGFEGHHMPASGAYPVNARTGVMPSIQMSPDDHSQTASWGSSSAASNYRNRQRSLIRQGKLREAFLMDVVDIQSKFPDGRYNEAIADAAAYMECINQNKQKYGLPAGQGTPGRRRR